MVHQLDENIVLQIEKTLNERFGDPLSTILQETRDSAPVICDNCGFMAEKDNHKMCNHCGAMFTSLKI